MGIVNTDNDNHDNDNYDDDYYARDDRERAVIVAAAEEIANALGRARKLLGSFITSY